MKPAHLYGYQESTGRKSDYNARELKACGGDGKTLLCAVVKANVYGHGEAGHDWYKRFTKSIF
jgi:alanine racemase